MRQLLLDKLDELGLKMMRKALERQLETGIHAAGCETTSLKCAP